MIGLQFWQRLHIEAHLLQRVAKTSQRQLAQSFRHQSYFECRTPPIKQNSLEQTHKLKFRRWLWSPANGNALHQALGEAEKLVGYSTSFLGLRYLLDWGPVNFAALAKKLVGSGHPLLSTARDLLVRDYYSSQMGGLWVLLISKAAGVRELQIDISQDYVAGIHQKQRRLAEVTEMINIAFLIHKGIVKIEDIGEHRETDSKTLTFGNKLAVLGGDYLLAKACLELAKVYNTKAVELISVALGHMAEAATEESFNENISSWTMENWEAFTTKSRGSLMANSCQAAILVSGHDEKVALHGYEFGKNLALAQQLAEDINTFETGELKSTDNINAVLVIGNYNNETKKCVEHSTQGNMNKNIWSEIVQELTENGTLRESRNRLTLYIEKALASIRFLPDADARLAIENILLALIAH